MEVLTFFAAVFFYVIHIIVLHWLIRSSNYAKKNKEHDQIMINLLMAIARKNGATEQEIGAAIGKKLG